MFLVPMTHRRAHLAHAVNRMFDDALFDRVAAPSQADTTGARLPALDVTETDVAYTASLDMPGVAKADVKIAIDGRRITVQAASTASTEPAEGERKLYSERQSASYTRSFVLPMEVEQAASSASMDHGVLRLQLAKRIASKAAQLTVN